MKKLDLFRSIGESFARSHRHLATKIGRSSCNAIATSYFREIANGMYPLNAHRHEWATANMEMFYTQECERIKIMDKLSTPYVEPHDTLSQIRTRI